VPFAHGRNPINNVQSPEKKKRREAALKRVGKSEPDHFKTGRKRGGTHLEG